MSARLRGLAARVLEVVICPPRPAFVSRWRVVARWSELPPVAVAVDGGGYDCDPAVTP